MIWELTNRLPGNGYYIARWNFTITTTKDWFPGGEPTSPADVAKQWHLTADFEASMNNKILTIIQLSDNGQVEDVWQVNNRFTLGDWIVEAEMAADKPATIKISNKTTGTVFDYGSVELQLDGVPYQRQQENSSVLYDDVFGMLQVQECITKPVQTTRSVR